MKPTMMTSVALLVCATLSACPAADPPDSALVMFWNVENFFMPGSPAMEGRHWTSRRFRGKCEAVSKTIFAAGDQEGRIPDVAGFAEVECRKVLERLLKGTLMRKTDYRIVHFDSPDHRGIDCALIYRSSTMHLKRAYPVHQLDSTGNILPTRDILVAEFDSLSVLVNHHPSKVGGKSSDTRTRAMRRMEFICDSLQASGCRRILCVGDFNDDVWQAGTKGTIKYNGEWEKIDGSFARGFSSTREEVLDFPFLMEPDAAYGGLKPRRTFSGPRWLGGVSDHLPIVVYIYF